MEGALNRVPSATYRLQFNRQFGFSDAEKIVSYLHELGISDLYLSPIFAAGAESTHGYDVCRFDQINPNLGSRGDFDRLVKEIRTHGMEVLLDMVPNHMGTHPSNHWWWDVLKNGSRSKFAHYFDINWNARPDGKLLMPVLGKRYGEVLRHGELKLRIVGGEVCLSYFDKDFPLSPSSQQQVDGQLEQINGSLERLHSVYKEQHYRLAFWRVGPHEINYRRFFDVSDLVSIRIEDLEVFNAAHHFVIELLKDGAIAGLRIDHPDGLRDPKTYFDRLQTSLRGNFYVVAEKILSDDEHLPADWAVSGTTGYDYLNFSNGIFIASQHEEEFSKIYREFTGSTQTYEQVAYEAKKEVLARLFPSELRSLTNHFRQIADQLLEGVDFTTHELESTIAEFIAAFPVYRTYAREGLDRLPPTEIASVRQAIESAGHRYSSLRPALNRLQAILESADTPGAREFVVRLQQLTGPAAAKGLEDTAFYRYVRFVSLNEVGGNPGRFGVSVEAFHQHNLDKQAHWPHSLLATATHDTKRGEDVRARLNVLSEMPAEWSARVNDWKLWSEQFKDEGLPCANDEYLLYQTLVGSWSDASGDDLDFYIQRINQYLKKATREAKFHTSWSEPNEKYEQTTKKYVELLLREDRFRSSLTEFTTRVGFFGVFNSLSQLLLKICSPGVPDFYQGHELWDFNLVDPDNRRAVDYTRRLEFFGRLKSRTDLAELLKNAATGEVKLFATRRALNLRRDNRDLFDDGKYIPIEVRGSKRDHVIAFTRQAEGKTAVVVVPRLPFLLAGGALQAPLGPELWEDTELHVHDLTKATNVFSGRRAGSNRLSDIFAEFPVALLHYGNTMR